MARGKGGKPATQEDLTATESKLGARIEETESRLGTRIEATESKLHAEIARLDAKTDRIAIGLVKTRADVGDIRLRMATRDDVSRIMGSIDGLAGHVQDLSRTIVVWDKILADHRQRIEALEARHPSA